MPSFYPVQLLDRVDSLINFMCGLANEPLTAEEQRYHDRHGLMTGPRSPLSICSFTKSSVIR